MTISLIALINSKSKEKWSPEQISARLREHQSTNISHESIYQYVWLDKKSGGNLFKKLRRKGKTYQSRSKDKQAGSGVIKNRISIDGRPPIV
ncbi:MAG: IS30 family transposase [Psychromonas sp.]|jgi:IS30 family transposase